MDDLQEIDAVGLLCPWPVLKAAKALRNAPPGTGIMVRATDPGALKDMPSLCEEKGYRLLSAETLDGIHIFHIEK